MKKPYLKKFGVIGKFTVWLVDGKFVRERIDAEFTNFGEHYGYRFIPTYEFWIDKEHAPGEEEFFIHHMLLEWRLIRGGMEYDNAFAYGDRSERAERLKSRTARRLKRIRSNKKLVTRIHKRLLVRYQNGLRVWLVRGEVVRDRCFVDYTEGGHDKVYAFVPEKEVWLDDDLSPAERRYVLLHEVHERRLMALGWSYAKAHRSATEVEFHCRRHPSELAKRLREEIRLNS
jgi:hypothetical protein